VSARAFDRRLLKYARTTRLYLIATVLLGAVTAVLLVAQAWLLAVAVAGAFADHRSLGQLRVPLLFLLVTVIGRAAVSWGAERASARASARAKSELRCAFLERVAAGGRAQLDDAHTGAITVLATRGIDALDGYFARYLPQVFLAVIVPVTVLAVIVGLDWISAAIIAVTLPLIPLFMGLVGATTRERTESEVRTLQRLATCFLDLVAGLPTLKVFGRAKAQAKAIGDITDRYRRTALATLRLAFLSSLILELLATLSVALVAVAVGLRLMGGHLTLQTALFVLVLAPEAYLPLRQLGANFHASAEGLSAAEQVFEVLEQPVARRAGVATVPDPSVTGISVDNVEVTYPGRHQAALRSCSLSVDPGEVVAVVGPSGCGKSTLVGVLLGLLAPESGSVHIGDVDLAELDLDRWRSRLAWVPQRPHLFATSISENIRLGTADASPHDVARAVTDAGLDDVVGRLPDGLDTRLGERGAGLSAGERQRVALARAFLRDAPLLLLDEPTANLDGPTEESVLRAVRRLVIGRTVLLVAHRPALVEMADRVVPLTPELAPL
jgi:ATP-binding cassette, subfamily C, bacterial CydCD